jgi:CubicO group peptidase (beta-lactamase class C family)
MSIRRSVPAAAACAAVACLVFQPALRSQADPLAGFDAYVTRAVQAWRTPGLAIAVVKDGRVVFNKGYGVRALGKSEPADTHTLFAIGSTTKAMTAALVGMLVDEGKLAWDDPVVKHLPWFQLEDPYLTREITVRDLLTHRAGLGNADYLWYGQTTTPREILQRVRLLEPSYSLRSSFIYQNVMYAAAGAVIEAASGRTWEQMIRERIFEPLGMRESIATAATLARQPNVAMPHDTIDGEVRVIDNASVDGVAPAGSVWSSVADMAKWMQMLLDGGTAGGRVLLKPETVDELFKPQAMVTRDGFYPTARLTRPHWTTYALGWFQQDYRGRAVDFHTGSIDGMVAIHGLIRDEKLGVYVLANRDHAELRHALMLSVFDRFIGSGERDWSAELLALYGGLQTKADEDRKREEAKRVAGTSPSLPLPRYAGTYSDPLYGDVVVTQQGGRLHARYGTAFVGTLEHWNYDTFRARWDAAWRGTALLTFTLDEHGQPSRLEALGARFARKPDPSRATSQR